MRIAAAVVAVVLVVIYAIGSGRYVATNSAWYLSLDAPPWQPPNGLLGLAWTYNFLALAVIGVLMALRAERSPLIGYLTTFAVSVVLALAWSYLFYEPHRLIAAAIALSLCALVTIVMVVLAFRTTAALGWFLLPYQAWLIIASSLSWGYAVLNPSP